MCLLRRRWCGGFPKSVLTMALIISSMTKSAKSQKSLSSKWEELCIIACRAMMLFVNGEADVMDVWERRSAGSTSGGGHSVRLPASFPSDGTPPRAEPTYSHYPSSRRHCRTSRHPATIETKTLATTFPLPRLPGRTASPEIHAETRTQRYIRVHTVPQDAD